MSKHRNPAEASGLAFLVQHVHTYDDGEEEATIIGIYSTKGLATEAVERLKPKSESCEHPGSFRIAPYEMDADHWTDRYVAISGDPDKATPILEKNSENRRQRIYRKMLQLALPSTRSSMMVFWEERPFMFLSKKRLQTLRSAYNVAQLVHSFSGRHLYAEFTNSDIWFLNYHAKQYYETNDTKGMLYEKLLICIQELFKEVPEERRHELTWPGPPGNYSTSFLSFLDD